MSLTLATLIPGLLLALAGTALLVGSPAIVSLLRGFPRSTGAAAVLFTAGALWFLYEVWHLPPADFGTYRVHLTIFFGVLGILAFVCIPDFLAVRGLCVLVLMGAGPLLAAGFMNYDHPQVYLYKVPVFVAIALAIWLGAQPWRLRDFVEWLFRAGGRARAVGGALLGYGLLLSIVAFTY